MKKIKFIFVTIVLALMGISNIFAQVSFNLPENIKLKTTADYIKYEPDIIAAAKWLEETDLNIDTKKRQEVNAFVSQWIIGTPVVSVRLSEPLQEIYGDNAALMIIYIASYSSYFLVNKTEATESTAIRAGLISMMKVYKKGIDIKRSKEMEKLIKWTAENKLDEYINEKLKTTDASIEG